MSEDSKITHHIFAGLQGDLLVCPKKNIIINTFLSVFVLLLSALSLKYLIKLSSLKAL